VGWIILGIFALGVIGLLALNFFSDMDDWGWPKILLVSAIVVIIILLVQG
jgi:hypothetical protein